MPLGQGAPTSEALGQLGSDFIGDTNPYTGQWGIIYCLTACTFSTLTSGKLADGSTSCMSGTLTGISLSPGMSIYGIFTAITLASGKIVAYKV